MTFIKHFFVNYQHAQDCRTMVTYSKQCIMIMHSPKGMIKTLL